MIIGVRTNICAETMDAHCIRDLCCIIPYAADIIFVSFIHSAGSCHQYHNSFFTRCGNLLILLLLKATIIIPEDSLVFTAPCSTLKHTF